MRPLHHSKPTIALLAGLTLSGSLAACSSPSTTDPGPDAGTGGGTGDYADGTYEATGEYQAPSGSESVDVTVTLEGGVITEVTVTSTDSLPLGA